MHMRKLESMAASMISKKIGKAIGEYNMIEDGDKVLVGVSGGKDSLTLLKMLKERQKWAPIKYTLHAAHIVVNPEETNGHEQMRILKDQFEEWEIPYTFKTLTLEFDLQKTNCFWCSWNKRKTLFELARDMKVTKIALGHHHDDIIQTTLLNMFYLGDISTMNPRQELFKGSIVLIRPLALCDEALIETYARDSGFPGKTICPYATDSNRAFMKEIIDLVEKRSPQVRTNIFRSIARIREGYIGLKEHGVDEEG